MDQPTQDFDLLGPITNHEVIAVNTSIRELVRLRKQFGPGRWRKMKGLATVRVHHDDSIHKAELHWYEAHGIGKRLVKIKTLLD